MTKYKILFLLMLALAGTPAAAQTSKPLNIGTTEVVHSDALKEDRKINIYLPEDYDPKKAEKYPVIYIPDGGFEEDFVHITGIVRFNNQPWINRFPQSIVVGIENTNRRRDFTFPVANTDFIEKEGFKKESFPQYGGSDKYINFLKNELQPYIEKNYNAFGNRTIIGESLAGLLATGIQLKNPEMFSQYIIISPSLWWGEEKLLKEAESLLRTHLKQPVKVYIGAPNKEEDTKMYAEAESLYKTLKTNKNISVSFDYLPDELHSTVIHQAVYNAFKKLYPKTEYSK